MRENPSMRLIAIFTLALVASAGLCLLDPDDDHAVGLDLCLTLLAAAGASVLTFQLPFGGRVAVATPGGDFRPSAEPSAPPPKP